MDRDTQNKRDDEPAFGTTHTRSRDVDRESASNVDGDGAEKNVEIGQIASFRYNLLVYCT